LKIFSQGGISQLELDCVVLPINEIKLTNSPLSREVHHAAGCLLSGYYKNIQGEEFASPPFVGRVVNMYSSRG